jgi:hypothetical protein
VLPLYLLGFTRETFGAYHMPSAYGIGEPAPQGYVAQMMWPFANQATRSATAASSFNTFTS